MRPVSEKATATCPSHLGPTGSERPQGTPPQRGLQHGARQRSRKRLSTQFLLAAQSGFHLMGQSQPFFSRPWAQIAERANDCLTRSLGGENGVYQQVVGVGLTLVGPRGLAEVHGVTIKP